MPVPFFVVTLFIAIAASIVAAIIGYTQKLEGAMNTVFVVSVGIAATFGLATVLVAG